MALPPVALTPEKQDANLVGFYKIRESVLGTVPATGEWQTREPNSFDDLGGEYTKVARRPFSPSRQRKKGSTTDLDADGGYNEDLTQNNMQSEFEEFFFAKIRTPGKIVVGFAPFDNAFTVDVPEAVAVVANHGLATGDGPFLVESTVDLPTGLAEGIPYWAVVIDNNSFKFASSYANAIAGLVIALTDDGDGVLSISRAPSVAGDIVTINHNEPAFVAGTVVKASGFALTANNGIKTVIASTATTVQLSGMVTEPSPPSGAKLEVVGVQFAAGDLALTVQESAPGVTSGFTITTTVADFSIFSLVPGSWVFIGGDAANTAFTDNGEVNAGYARIASVAADFKSVSFDKSTFPAVADNGAGKTILLYLSDVIKNEPDPDDIIRYSSTIERTLGRDADGQQSEFINGAVASEMTWNSPLANLVNIDMSYTAQRANTRKGSVGPLTARPGNVIARALGEDAFNTSSNIYRIRMGLVDPQTLNPSALFARVSEWSFSINNNVSAAKAQGVLGGFDTTVGNFDVDGEFTAYFNTVDAIHAVQCNWDITFDAIYAKQNAGIYIDVPLIGLGGGRLDIEQDAPIMLPLQAPAAESSFGHTALIGWFPYLPSIAMPDVDC